MTHTSDTEKHLQHWVDDRPFDPQSKEVLTPEQEKFYMASQWQLMWWKFRRHKLALISGIVLALFVVGRLQQAGKMAWPAFGLVAAPFLIFGAFALPSSYAPEARDLSASLLEPQAFSRETLAEARSTGQPVFVWFTADWCVTCKVNESVAIEREATRAAFAEAGVVALRGDWTQPDEEISRMLTRQGAAGVPLYLWYAPGGEAEQLPQVLTPDLLVRKARASEP